MTRPRPLATDVLPEDTARLEAVTRTEQTATGENMKDMQMNDIQIVGIMAAILCLQARDKATAVADAVDLYAAAKAHVVDQWEALWEKIDAARAAVPAPDDARNTEEGG